MPRSPVNNNDTPSLAVEPTVLDSAAERLAPCGPDLTESDESMPCNSVTKSELWIADTGAGTHAASKRKSLQSTPRSRLPR